jgi:hypothetical protein
MLDIEKVQKRFETDSLREIMEQYDRDFLMAPVKEDIPPNPQPQASDDLFAQQGAAEQRKETGAN